MNRDNQICDINGDRDESGRENYSSGDFYLTSTCELTKQMKRLDT